MTDAYSTPTGIVEDIQPGSFAQAVYAQLLPLQTLDLLHYIGAIGDESLQILDSLVHSDGGDDAWAPMVDLERTPDAFLEWLGQFIGYRMSIPLTPNGLRQALRDKGNWGRGTPEFLANSIKTFLTGTQTVIITERDTSPYHVTVQTYASETPGSTTVINNVLQANKPAGLVLSYSTIGGTPTTETYLILYNTGDSYSDVYVSSQTYADIS
jgi:hypothetical protein